MIGEQGLKEDRVIQKLHIQRYRGLDGRKAYIFKESAVYSFIQTENNTKNVESYFITHEERNIVEVYVQTIRMMHLYLLITDILF